MSETLKRIISGVIIAGFYAISFNVDNPADFLIYLTTLFFVIIGLHEFYSMTSKDDNNKPYYKLGFFFGLTFVTIIFLGLIDPQKDTSLPNFLLQIADKTTLSFSLFGALILLFLFSTFFLNMISGRIEGSTYSIAVTILGVIYINFSASHLLLLNRFEYGTFFIWLVSWATIMSDTMAYFIGKFLGKHKVGFAASPNKSYEGYIGGLVAQVISTVAFYHVSAKYFDVPSLSTLEIILLASVIFIVSVIGDLTESIFKRDAKVKDSSDVIPGHGGILDLIDALILTVPSTYYFLIFLNYIKTL